MLAALALDVNPNNTEIFSVNQNLVIWIPKTGFGQSLGPASNLTSSFRPEQTISSLGGGWLLGISCSEKKWGEASEYK